MEQDKLKKRKRIGLGRDQNSGIAKFPRSKYMMADARMPDAIAIFCPWYPPLGLLQKNVCEEVAGNFPKTNKRALHTSEDA